MLKRIINRLRGPGRSSRDANAKRAVRRALRVRPTLEVLEDRTLLDGDPFPTHAILNALNAGTAAIRDRAAAMASQAFGIDLPIVQETLAEVLSIAGRLRQPFDITVSPDAPPPDARTILEQAGFTVEQLADIPDAQGDLLRVSQTLDFIRNKPRLHGMLTYTRLKKNRREFVALTGLTPREFQRLLPAFQRAYQRLYPGNQTLTGKPRQRQTGGGRKTVLAGPEQKLLFALVYQKTYSLQVLLGEVFALSQPRVNYWIHRLLPVLQHALDDLGVVPARNPRQFARSERRRQETPELIIDGTERRRQRPKNQEKQALHYSGKKKTHTDKNVVIVNAHSKRISYLSRTYAGKTHDKKIADSERICYRRETVLHKDTGFQGYEPPVQKTYQPKKNPGADN